MGAKLSMALIPVAMSDQFVLGFNPRSFSFKWFGFVATKDHFPSIG
jgi:hypothetical protein